MKETIHFYYTNDLHSYFNHWPQVATFLHKMRADCEQKGESYWLFDIGDHMDRVHPITEATMGKANVALLNAANYDFVTLGNNEGVTLSHDDLFHLYDTAEFDVICSNLQCTKSANPDWLKSSHIVQSQHGVRIGIIGLTARFNPYYHLLGWHADLIHETIQLQIDKLESQTDVLVLMSHLGISEDEEIARKFPEIDVIMGGHTHHLLRTGQEVNKTLLTAAGKHCSYVGEVMLTYDHHLKKVIEKEAYTTNITHLPQDEETTELLNRLSEDADSLLGNKIIETKEPIPIEWYEPVPIMEALTNKVREITEADCAMLNAGLLVEGFDSGVITYRDVHQACPHPINPCVVTLTGDELIEVVRASLSKSFMEIQLKGFGFRGKVIGRMVFSNLDIEIGEHLDGQNYVKDIYYTGRPLDGEKLYKVATADMFTFGKLLPPVARSSEKHLFLPEFIREILVETLKEYKG